MSEHVPTPSPIRQVPVSPAAVTQDQAERLARLGAAKNAAPKNAPSLAAPASVQTAAAPTRTNLEPKSARRLPGSQRKSHPARGARAIALAASVTATVGVGGAMAYADAAEPVAAASEVVATTTLTSGTATAEVPTTLPLEVPAEIAAALELLPASEPGALEALTAIATPETVEVPAVEDALTEASPTRVDEAVVVAESEVEPAVEVSPPVVATIASGLADGVFSGTAEYTEWGNVQVQVTIVDGNIVDIAALQMPSGRKSTDINNAAEPVLEAQAVATQSADLDIVSGATYTSATYEDSLQAALDQAALAQQSTTQDTP